jgi:glycosyltransferase involved in cell wall biosynthesis
LIKVFVQLAHGTDARQWQARLADGRVLGVNERSPYGYHLAAQWGCDVAFSRDTPESGPMRLWRRGLRRLLGFDAIHAARNEARLRACDVVWTHTECQTLSVLLMRKWRGGGPRVIGQSIWLFDDWARLAWPLRPLYRWLLRDACVLTVHSPDNLAVARREFPAVRSELVKFGVGSGTPLPQRIAHAPAHPCQLISVGNDRDRDWPTLIAAVAGDPRFALTIVCESLPEPLLAGQTNVRRVRPANNDELFALYAQADIAVVPLRANLHASGGTAIQEATLLGLPVAATRAGGLEAYFDDRELRYVPVGDAALLKATLVEMSSDPVALAHQVVLARAKVETELGAANFVRRHVALTREVLGIAP